jgi:hypothetical protein
MDRRRFLSSTMLSGLGIAVLAAPAKALTIEKCEETGDLACRELARHEALIDQINSLLAQNGLDEAQRRAIMASAVCPFCGRPLFD